MLGHTGSAKNLLWTIIFCDRVMISFVGTHFLYFFCEAYWLTEHSQLYAICFVGDSHFCFVRSHVSTVVTLIIVVPYAKQLLYIVVIIVSSKQ